MTGEDKDSVWTLVAAVPGKGESPGETVPIGSWIHGSVTEAKAFQVSKC